MPKFGTGCIRFFSLNFFSSDLAVRTCMFQKSDCFRKISAKLVVLLCKCVYLCLYILGKFRDVRTKSGIEYKLVLFLCVCTPVSPSVPEMEGIYATGVHPI